MVDDKEEQADSVSSDIISKWIERYYEDKLDKRDKGKVPGASAFSRKPKGLLAQLFSLN